MIEERDHYEKKYKDKEAEVDELKVENLELKQKINEQKLLIDEYVKKTPDKGAFFDGGKNDY